MKLTSEVEEEVSGMCSYATAMENKGIEKGVDSSVRKLALHFIKEDPTLSEEKAIKMAEKILRD